LMPRMPTFRSLSQAAGDLRDLLVMAEKTGTGLDDEMRALADAAIEELCSARVACPPSLLGDSSAVETGLWRAVYTQGKTPRWQTNAKLFRAIVANKAGQAYDAENGIVTNYGEILGPAVHFMAKGSFKAVDGAEQCPKDFQVSIEEGGLVVLGLPLISSAISGPGYLRVLYIDNDIRIFEAPMESRGGWEQAGLRVVQLREDLFSDS